LFRSHNFNALRDAVFLRQPARVDDAFRQIAFARGERQS
jgi:hypothetical protein